MTITFFTAIVARTMMLVWNRKDSVTIVAHRTGGVFAPMLDGYRYTIRCGVELSCFSGQSLLVDLPASLSPPSHRMVVLWLHLFTTGSVRSLILVSARTSALVWALMSSEVQHASMRVLEYAARSM